MTWFDWLLLGFAGVIFAVGLAYLWLRLMWRFVWNRPVPHYGPEPTPEFLERLHNVPNYIAEQDRLKAEAEARAKAERIARILAEEEARAKAEEEEKNRPDPREERRREWLAREEARKQADLKRQQKEAEAIKAFPAWLVTLAERRNFDLKPDVLEKLQGWVKIVLEYADYQPGRRVSVRGLFGEFKNSPDAPLRGVTSYKFFADLLKILDENGKLEDDPAQTNARRLVEKWQ